MCLMILFQYILMKHFNPIQLNGHDSVRAAVMTSYGMQLIRQSTESFKNWNYNEKHFNSQHMREFACLSFGQPSSAV